MVSQMSSGADRPSTERGPDTSGAQPVIRILGPVEVIGPNGQAQLSRGHERAVIGALALVPGTEIRSSRLVKALWPDMDEPDTAVRTLHAHVSRVRAKLRACGLP